MYTLTKAPMAHKTNSKEQFVFRFFKLKMSMATRFQNNETIQSLNGGALTIYTAKQSFPKFSTNFLLLKRSQLGITIKDTHFFNFSYFCNVNSIKKF
jgi:hypothetical protein